MAGVSNVGAISKALNEIAAKRPEGSAESSFADTLSDAIKNFKNSNKESDIASLDLLTGNTDELHSVMIASEKAEIALNLTVAIRNKAVDAYKEIMNMQV